jgi:hypothetical protein
MMSDELGMMNARRDGYRDAIGTVMQWHTDYHGLDTDFRIFTECAFAVLRVVLLTDYQ